jgi:ubiquinone/menaquinone biosynthesis C-methylase UbiE
MHEKRFNRDIERLRDPERLARLEVKRVVNLTLEGLGQPELLLDVGTGSGVFAEQFAKQGLKVAGLDANPEMLAAARSFVPKGDFYEGTAEKLPFPDYSFDVVFMGLLLHETDETLSAMCEARRVTKERLAVLEWTDEVQAFGPPKEDRLSSEKIRAFGNQAGFKQVSEIQLNTLVLYLLDV